MSFWILKNPLRNAWIFLDFSLRQNLVSTFVLRVISTVKECRYFWRRQVERVFVRKCGKKNSIYIDGSYLQFNGIDYINIFSTNVFYTFVTSFRKLKFSPYSIVGKMWLGRWKFSLLKYRYRQNVYLVTP